ncbi:hypothetical protein Fot_21557 [Forsythia ovata]|uniref:Uncharacterized protein n=1 Tax=Forsythia ovata TaxID=205694 RepID=A0ABD1UV70_9LAMI
MEAEIVRDFVMVENEDLVKKLQDKDANLFANFHLTDAYTSFSNYFASVGQQEVITALRSERPDLDLSSLKAKFPPMDIVDPPDSTDCAEAESLNDDSLGHYWGVDPEDRWGF